MKTTINTFAAAAIATVLTTVMAAAQPPWRNLEPTAGNWKTWVIPTGSAYRVPAPPGPAETRAELRQIKALVGQVDEAHRKQVRHWDAGPPAYRWMDMLERQVEAGEPLTPHPHRVLTYVALAMYDATIAAWHSKYAYNRQRPSDLDSAIQPLVEVPLSPSYPSEHSAAAGAAVAVLSHFFPEKAAAYAEMAEQAGLSRVVAGVQYPSDHSAGMHLGKQVAQKVIERIVSDGYTPTGTGTVPVGRCLWTGANPGNSSAPGWRTFLLNSAGEFRPAPPADCESPQVKVQVGVVRDFPRTFTTNQKAYYWQSPEGRETKPFILLEKWMFEDGLDKNPPRAARAYALLHAAHYDTFIANQDAKYAYWYIRPHQLDSDVKPLFPPPNFPSYPSNHAAFSWGRAEMLTYLFPQHAAEANAMGLEAAQSRVWAGIHYQMDLDAGKAVGRGVAQKYIQWAENDGSK